MQDRLQAFLDAEQLTSSRFADAVGVQRSSISHILSGRNKPSYDFLQKVIKAFPYVSAEWLLTGIGEMYKDSQETVTARGLFDDSDAVGPPVETPSPGAVPEIRDASDKEKEMEKDRVDRRHKPEDRALTRVILMYSDNSFESFEPQQ